MRSACQSKRMVSVLQISHDLACQGSFQLMPILNFSNSFTSLQGSSVSECVVSSSYIALLLEDGRVCRIRYSEEHPPLPSNMTSSNTSNKEKR